MSTPAATSGNRGLALAAALLIVPGLWLRVRQLDWMEFSGDELALLRESYRAGHEHFALHGIPASIGLPLPNFLLYLLALPLSCTRDPVRIVALVALWNVLGLACVLRALWRLVPPATALAGTALLASAPGPLLLARKIWNPDFLFGGVALLLLLLALHLERPRRWVTLSICAACALLCGFHASAWPLFPCVLAWAWMLRVPFERRGLLLGLLGLLALFAPYLVYVVSSGFDDVRGLWWAHQAGAPIAEGWCAAVARHARAALDASCCGELLASASSGSWSSPLARVGAGAFLLWTAVASLTVLLRSPWVAWRAWRGQEVSTFDKLLAFGALFEMLLLALYARAHLPSLPHHCAVLSPFPTLAALWLAWRVGARIGQLPLLAASTLVVAAHTQLFCGFQAELQRHGPPPGMHLALPFEPHAARWRAEIERSFEEIDSGHAAERAEQQRLRLRYEAASEVLMRYDARRDDPPVARQGRVETRPGPDGLEVFGSSPVDLLRLPPLELGGRGHALLRLEIWSPKEVAGFVFYATVKEPEYARNRTLPLPLRAGENTVYLEIPDADASGRLMISQRAYRWLLRAAEVRRTVD